VNWTSIYATAAGIVTIARSSESLGNYVSISHGNGYLTRFGHMEKFIVKEGQLVERGQIIGYMGNTGRSTGSHVHYEVWKNNVPINPIAFILPEYSVE
jgi:murein DD-endopeptidase MepM/ murein hydrolase activator NlpD